MSLQEFFDSDTRFKNPYHIIDIATKDEIKSFLDDLLIKYKDDIKTYQYMEYDIEDFDKYKNLIDKIYLFQQAYKEYDEVKEHNENFEKIKKAINKACDLVDELLKESNAKK